MYVHASASTPGHGRSHDQLSVSSSKTYHQLYIRMLAAMYARRLPGERVTEGEPVRCPSTRRAHLSGESGASPHSNGVIRASCSLCNLPPKGWSRLLTVSIVPAPRAGASPTRDGEEMWTHEARGVAQHLCGTRLWACVTWSETILAVNKRCDLWFCQCLGVGGIHHLQQHRAPSCKDAECGSAEKILHVPIS